MATITSAATGNWSATGTWVGGVVPTSADDVVIAANHIVTLDVDATIISLTGAANATSNVTISTSRTLTCTATNGIIAKSLTGPIGGLVRITGIGIIVNINSNLIGAATGGGQAAVSVNSVCVVNINGELSNPLVNSGGVNAALNVQAAATINIIGNVTGGTNTGAPSANAIYANSACVLNILGNVLGGTTGANGTAIVNTISACTINITGSCIARIAPAISSTQGSTLTISGSIAANNNTPSISSTSTAATVRVSGPLINQNNINAVFSPKIQYFSDSHPTYTFQSDTFGKDVTFYDTSFTSSLPTQTDVRSGSLYGGSNEFSGSMVVPATSSVRYGVPVDQTTGSATLTPQDILTYAVSSLTGSNTIGARLQNIATVQTTAATIAAFKGK
jgi:hypothetical protein